MQAVYNEAVRQYKAGQLDAARAGFAQVSESGISVKGDQPAGDYILAIDLQRDAAARQQSQQAQAVEQAVEELMPQGTATGQTFVVEPAAVAESSPAASATVSAPQSTGGAEDSYLQVILREKAVRIDYTTAIVNDALSRAQTLRQEARFEEGRQVLRRALSTVERNKLLLGDALFSEYMAKLNNEEQALSEQQRTWQAEQDRKRAEEATKLTADIRNTIDSQRAEAIEEYLDRAYAFQDEQRYEEALGQLEQLLLIDPLHQRALIMKRSLENWTRYREQRRIQEESDREELELLMEASRKSIPFSKEIHYPRNWKEIAARREQALQETMSPADILVNKQLEEAIDLTMLTPDTTLEEAINILRNSVDPKLTIIVLWPDLSQNAFIERDTAVNMSGEGLVSITLRTALNRILQAVSSAAMADLGFVIEEGVVTVATRDSLPTSFTNSVYDVSDLLNPPANYDEDYSSQGGGMGGQGGGMGGMGGGMGGGMMGGMGGGMMGGMGGGMMGGMGGGMGGMGGGMGGMAAA
jgi:tetratricopeptide (TPR) repeat protein